AAQLRIKTPVRHILASRPAAVDTGNQFDGSSHSFRESFAGFPHQSVPAEVEPDQRDARILFGSANDLEAAVQRKRERLFDKQCSPRLQDWKGHLFMKSSWYANRNRVHFGRIQKRFYAGKSVRDPVLS